MTSNKGMSWKWNPPAAPHFGGVFESMIKSAKRAIFAVLGDAEVNYEELEDNLHWGRKSAELETFNSCE